MDRQVFRILLYLDDWEHRVYAFASGSEGATLCSVTVETARYSSLVWMDMSRSATSWWHAIFEVSLVLPRQCGQAPSALHLAALVSLEASALAGCLLIPARFWSTECACPFASLLLR